MSLLTVARHTTHRIPKVDPRKLGTRNSCQLYVRADKGLQLSGAAVTDIIDQSPITNVFENLPNSVTNPGFEAALGAEWTQFINATGTTARDTTISNYGVASLRLVMTNAGGVGQVVSRYQNLVVVAGQVWSFRCSVRIDELTNCRFGLQIEWYDAGAGFLGTANTEVATTGWWQTVNLLNQTAPVGAVQCRIYGLLMSTAAAATGTAYVDGVRARLSSTLPTVYSRGLGISNSFYQPTGSKRPAFQVARFGRKPAVYFDGGDLLEAILGGYLSGSTGTVIGTLIITATLDDRMALLSSGREASVSYTRVQTRVGNATPYMASRERIAGVEEDEVAGATTALQTSAKPLILTWISTAGAYQFRADGRPQTISVIAGANQGKWFGAVASRVNTTIGATKTTAESEFFSGRVGVLLAYNVYPGTRTISRLQRAIKRWNRGGLR